METSADTGLLHGRLHDLVASLRSRMILEELPLERLSRLRALGDLRLRSLALGRPRLTGTDICTLLGDPQTGRFDRLALEEGLLAPPHLAIPLDPSGPTTGLLIEACLALQVLGVQKTRETLKELVRKAGRVPGSGLPASSPAAPRPLPAAVEILLKTAKDLGSPPDLLRRLLDRLEVPETPPPRIVEAIGQDPRLASTLDRLREILSGVPPRATPSPSEYPFLRRILPPAALLSRLAPPPGIPFFDRKAFWSHSLGTAHGARLACRALGKGIPESHFLAGLLHDLGRLAVAHLMPSRCDLLQDSPAREREALGTDHAELGACLAERWGLGRGVVEAARHHHLPPDRLEDLELTREAAVAISLCALDRPGTDAGAWIPLLGIPQRRLGEIRLQAGRLAEESRSLLEAQKPP